MKTSVIGIAFVATATLFGLAAHAGCADPRVGPPQHAPLILNHGHFGPHEGIVGTWLVTYSNGGQAYIQWHSDGTEWESINFDTISGNICLGSWESKGPWTYSRNHFGWLFDPVSGKNVGYFNEVETDTLATDGNSYNGTNTTYFFASDGTAPAPGFPVSAPGTSSAVRIAP